MRAYEREAEFDPELDEYGDTEAEYREYGDGESGEYDEFGDGEFGDGELDEFEEEFAEEMEQFLAELDELGVDHRSPLSAEEEMELAEELLETSDEEELDHFLGGLVARVVGRAATSGPVRRLVTGVLKRAPRTTQRYTGWVGRQDKGRVDDQWRKYLARRQKRRRNELVAHDPQLLARQSKEYRRLRSRPPLEQAAGYRRIRRAETSQWRDLRRAGEHPVKRFARKGAPWFGWGVPAGVAGSLLASPAANVLSSLFEVESEGMSPEEAEFEAARRYVRLSAAAARNAAAARRRARPRRAARAALLAAARRYAPGMYRRFPLYVRPVMSYPDGPQEPTSFQDTSFQDEPVSSPDEPMDFQDEPQPAGSNGRPARRPESGRWMRRGNRIIITGL